MHYHKEYRSFYECKIYMGSVNYSTKDVYSQDEIELYCGQVQEEYEYIIPLRITETTFISETTYQEKGWEITAIDYPRLHFTRKQIRNFMRHLAESLMFKFGQHTICVSDKDEIMMLENTDIFPSIKR